jgi:hypothetical protein
MFYSGSRLYGRWIFQSSVTIRGNIQAKLSSNMHSEHSPLHSSNELNYLDFFFDHLNWEVQTSISYSEKFETSGSEMYVQTYIYIYIYKAKHNCAQCPSAVERANQHQRLEKHTVYYEIPCLAKINNLCCWSL